MCGEPSHEYRFFVQGGNFQNAGYVSSRIKNLLKQLGMKSGTVRRAAIVAYESEINVVSYAKSGLIDVMVSPGDVRIVVQDEGPGIADIELAMQEGYSTASPLIREMGFGAGMGLSNMKKYSDLFEISSEIGIGTTISILIKNTEEEA